MATTIITTLMTMTITTTTMMTTMAKTTTTMTLVMTLAMKMRRRRMTMTIFTGLNFEKHITDLFSSLCSCCNLQDIGVPVYFLRLGVEFSLWIPVDITLRFPSFKPFKNLAVEVTDRTTFYSHF